MNATRTAWLKDANERLADLAEEAMVISATKQLPQYLKESTVSRVIEEVNFIEKTIDVVLGIETYPIKLDANKAANFHLN